MPRFKSYYFTGGYENLKLHGSDQEPTKPLGWISPGDSSLSDRATFSEQEMEVLLGKVVPKGLYDGNEAYWALSSQDGEFEFVGHFATKGAANSDSQDWTEEWHCLFMSESEWVQARKDFAELRNSSNG